MDLNDSDTREAFEETVNYVWGFEIDEDKRADLAEQNEENMMCGEPGIIDEILKKAACGDFGDESYYIQINGGGVQDEDTNLSYLQDSCQTLDNQTSCEENLLEEAIQNYNQAEKSGSRADKEKAFSSLEKICAETADCPEALYLLGMCYIKEWGCKKNLQRSFELFTQAAQMDHPKAKWKLGLYYEGKGNVVEKDYSKACNFYTEAAEAGVVEAQRLLGRLCLQMGDIEKGRECLRDAIAAGDDKAKNLLAAYYIQQVEIFDKRIAVTPDIDAGNLRRANLEYAIPYGIYNSPDELMGNALVLIGDDDPTGGASGVLITTRGIFSQEKSLFKKTQHSAKLTASTQITLPDDTLYVDAEPFFRFKKASTEDIRNLIAALKRYQKDL